jgi:hypothetical protein
VKIYQAVAATLFLCLAFVQAAASAEDFRGTWTIARGELAGKVDFGVQVRRHGNHNMMSRDDWPLSEFQGLDITTQARHDVQFALVRDAGRIDCEGFVKDGEGAGTFRFTPNAKYQPAMSALGFGDFDEEKQFAMALHNVSLEFARQMKSENLIGLDTDKLIAFGIFNVTHEFIRDMRASGMPAREADKLIAFRVHGITPAFVAAIKKAGFNVDEDHVIAMKIHGVTPEWIALMAKNGYSGLDEDKLIAFRIHGVTPEFIEKVEGMGFKHPDPDDLVAMRIHNVTPEYIKKLKDRGVKDLTIDQLVSLRIHGID